MIQLSKSDYMLYLKHPAWLWLKKHDKKKLPPIDDNTQAIFDAGNLFETYAQQYFPQGVKLGFTDYDEYLDLPQRTKRAIDNGTTTLFQARFEHGSITCICDVVNIVADNTIDLYEIKSSTKAKPDHEWDLAFQMVVLEDCGYKVNKIYVIHVNNEYVKQGEIDYKQLCTISNITETVKEKRQETKQNIQKALKIIQSPIIPDISPSLAKGESYKEWLEIYKNLVTVDPYSIYDLARANGEIIGKLEELKIKRLIDINDSFPLSQKQRLQIQSLKTDTPIINKVQIKNFLDKLTFPVYFLDYETLASIIPAFDGLGPFQQLPFQYSLHRLHSPYGAFEHFMYLHKTNDNPAEPLSKSLRTHLENTGTILVWNESFEKSCNTLLGKLIPEYESFYEQLNDRIIDLMIPFSSDWYVHKDFEGSASIKKVLPVLVPELSYKELGIHEGAGAQRLWMEAVLDGKREDEKEHILSDLEKYCKLDTFAMFGIYRQLMKTVDIKNPQTTNFLSLNPEVANKLKLMKDLENKIKEAMQKPYIWPELEELFRKENSLNIDYIEGKFTKKQVEKKIQKVHDSMPSIIIYSFGELSYVMDYLKVDPQIKQNTLNMMSFDVDRVTKLGYSYRFSIWFYRSITSKVTMYCAIQIKTK